MHWWLLRVGTWDRCVARENLGQMRTYAPSWELFHALTHHIYMYIYKNLYIYLYSIQYYYIIIIISKSKRLTRVQTNIHSCLFSPFKVFFFDKLACFFLFFSLYILLFFIYFFVYIELCISVLIPRSDFWI